MKKINLLYAFSLFVLLVLPSCEDSWTGREVIIEELTISNGDIDGCIMDSVQLYALDQNGDTTTNVRWLSGNSTVTVDNSGLAVLVGGNSEFSQDFGTASANIMAKSVADNVTSAPISIKSTNPSPLDQINGTWLAKSLGGDTLGSTAGGYVYQSLTINSAGTWQGEVRTETDTTTGSGYFDVDITQWWGYNVSDTTWTNLQWVTKQPNSTMTFSTYCSNNNGTTVGSDSCRIVSNGDTTYLTENTFTSYCSSAGDQDGSASDTSGAWVCTYTALDTSNYNLSNADWTFPSDTTDRAFYDAMCSISDTLANLVPTWNSGKSVRQ